MTSTNERKRSFETALQDSHGTNRLAKRPRQDFQPNPSAFQAASQPMGFRPDNELQQANFILFSAPSRANISSETASPFHDQSSRSETTPIASQPLSSPKDAASTDQTRLTGSQESFGLSALISRSHSLTSRPFHENSSNSKQLLNISPEIPTSPFFAIQETGQIDDPDDITNILDENATIHEHTPSSNTLTQQGRTKVDGLHGLSDELPPSQTALAPQKSGQIDIETATMTTRTTPHAPLQAPEIDQQVTPRKPSLPSSSPFVAIPPSSPFGLPAKSTSKIKNPFSDPEGQETLASSGGASGVLIPHHAEALLEDVDSAKPAPSQELTPRLKKENVHGHQASESRPDKKQSSMTDVKSHEASSNLSKAAPSHPSLPSQNRSTKKIRTPFRSPLVNKTLQGNQLPSRDDHPPPHHPRTKANGLTTALQLATVAPETKKRGALSRIKGTGTMAARAAFKSPLRAGGSVAGSGGSSPNVSSPSLKVAAGGVSRNDPRQQRLQLLRRAVKIKESGEDAKLEGLVRKWREVGKEVAWELWGLVKEGNVGEATDSPGNAGLAAAGFGGLRAKDRGWLDGGDGPQQGWGWDAVGSEGESWGESGPVAQEDEKEDEDEDPKIEERTMGSMLRQLGIAQETLGWDEEEGDFKDITT